MKKQPKLQVSFVIEFNKKQLNNFKKYLKQNKCKGYVIMSRIRWIK